jgi:hypothetical protein
MPDKSRERAVNYFEFSWSKPRMVNTGDKRQLTAPEARQVILDVLSDGRQYTLNWLHRCCNVRVQGDRRYITTPQIRGQLRRLYEQEIIGIEMYERGWFRQYRYSLMKSESAE